LSILQAVLYESRCAAQVQHTDQASVETVLSQQRTDSLCFSVECCGLLCSERADIVSSHARQKKDLQEMAEAMKVSRM
jgi:hypothetical protein